jgi:hypothetical protein
MARKAGWQIAGPSGNVRDSAAVAALLCLFNPESRRNVRADRTFDEEGIADGTILLLRLSSPNPAAVRPGTDTVQSATCTGMGPIGKVRNPFVCVILLPILTLGIYSLVWFCAMWSEARRYGHGRNGIKISGGGTAFFLYILLPGIIGAASGIVAATSGRPGATVLGLLPAALLVLAGLTKTAGLPRKMRIAKGVSPAQAGHPGAMVLICLVPFIGILMFWLAVQIAMNDFWRKEAQTT